MRSASSSGFRAIERGDNPFALGAIICDLNMPKMNGMEAITYFRSHFPHTSVIVLSGEVTNEKAGILLMEGVSSIMSKPVNQDKLLAAVKKAFGTK